MLAFGDFGRSEFSKWVRFDAVIVKQKFSELFGMADEVLAGLL